jgi:hypothetical protein
MSVGTAAYMSPEQFLNEPITEKTDVYGLGLMAYELLVGEGPYATRSPAELMAAHLRDEPRKLTALRPEVDSELEGLVRMCLEKDAAKRPSAQYISDHLTHGVGALLEWPPPGLEDFASRFNSVVLAFMLGGYVIGVTLVGLSTMDLDDSLRQSLPSAGALVVLTGLGALSLLVGAVSLVRLFVDARRAVKRGFGWLTLAEAACDERGDAGALIAGGREYAALSPAERNALRWRRLDAGAMRMAGALMPIVGYVGGVLIAARFGAGEMVLVLVSLFLGLALLVCARALTWMEEWKLWKSRARMAKVRGSRADDARLGDSWTVSFDAVRAGQSLGAGRPSGVLRSAFAQLVVAGAAFVILGSICTLGYAMAAIGSLTELTFNNFGGATFGGMIDRVHKLDRLRTLRLPRDSTISAQAAGELLKSFSGADKLLWVNAAEERFLRDARHLTPGTRDTLRQAAANPQLAAFRTFARAPTYDYLGAAMSLGKLDSLSIPQVPIMRMSPMRLLAAGDFAAGVLAMADGRNAEAELRFKEVLSAGFLMIGQGNTLIEALVGRTLVLKGRLGLTALYQQTGRAAEAGFVSEASDPSDASVPDRQMNLDQRQARVRAMALVKDKSMFRGVRMESLFFPLAYGPCGDLKQIVFGVDPTYTMALRTVRKELVRFPSDSVFFDKISLALDRPMIDGFGDGAWDYKLLAPIARVVDFLTGSKRLQSCVSMLS